MHSFSGRFCSNGKMPDTLMTTGYRMLVIYKSSPNQHNHRGFKANYEGLKVSIHFFFYQILSQWLTQLSFKRKLFVGEISVQKREHFKALTIRKTTDLTKSAFGRSQFRTIFKWRSNFNRLKSKTTTIVFTIILRYGTAICPIVHSSESSVAIKCRNPFDPTLINCWLSSCPTVPSKRRAFLPISSKSSMNALILTTDVNTTASTLWGDIDVNVV